MYKRNNQDQIHVIQGSNSHKHQDTTNEVLATTTMTRLGTYTTSSFMTEEWFYNRKLCDPKSQSLSITVALTFLPTHVEVM